MDNELFELCKQVYEATGWKDTLDYQWKKSNGDIENQRAGHMSVRGGWWDTGTERQVPLYTSDYLLEKLPRSITIDTVVHPIRYDDFIDGTKAFSYWDTDIHGLAVTPLKALLKLTLALKEAKLL